MILVSGMLVDDAIVVIEMSIDILRMVCSV